MEITYRTVAIYADSNDNIITISCGKSDKYGIADIDVINELKSPYSDSELEKILIETMNRCFTKTHDDSTSTTCLERYLKAKGYSRAVKNRRYISFCWNIDDGYFVIPTNKIPKSGFVHIDDKSIQLGKEIKEGELAKALRKSMEISTTY